MTPKNNPSRFHHRTLTALMVLLFAGGSGAALAEDRSNDRDGYRERERTEEHRASRGRHDHREKDRYDRHRKHRDDRRYDRHRAERHRAERHRADRYRDHRYRDRHYRDDRYRNDRYRSNHRNDRYRDHRYRTRHFDIPRAIARELLHSFASYHHSRHYYSAHRHHHEVYRFPVYSEYGVEYYPYAYCEGNYYNRGSFRDGRPVFDVRVSF